MRTFLRALLVLGIAGTCFAFPEIDFERASDSTSFSITPSTSGYQLQRSQDYYKKGGWSLKWVWPNRATGTTNVKLELNLGTNERTESSELRSGGIKFWMYRANKTPTSTMQITFVGTDKRDTPAARSCPTDVNLNFKGWRGVWIGYDEFIPAGQFNLKKLTSIEFNITSTIADTLYIDLIQFVESQNKQTRDVIVRRVGQPNKASCDSTQPTSSPDPPMMPVPAYYSVKSFWQQSLRWYDETESVMRSAAEITDVEIKINEIKTIENRLENWYADTTQAVSFLEESVANPSDSSGYDFTAAKKSRWETLSMDILKAHDLYNNIQFEQKRPSLFTTASTFGESNIDNVPTATSKFGFVFSKVVLPLSIEYNFMSRDVEIKYLAKKYCSDLLSAQNVTTDLEAVTKIAGSNTVMKGEFKTLVDEAKADTANPLNCNKVNERIPSMEKVIRDFNKKRFQRIKRLLEFLQDQGWAEGSGLGSIDHEMNKVGSGFMHSMFLLRKALTQETDLFNSLIGAMKWYNDFNEIHQPENNYVYDGTTADRMRTILLYRLMIVLMTPATSPTDKKNKIRNMIHFKTWFKHALKINKGLGGVIKPDFTGFHHKTFYGSAYVPHALHNAALVQYLIGGTRFALDQESKKNIRKALEVFRIVAVKYSTPNGICGRFPGYDRAILAKHVPAYAYSSYVHAHGAVTEGVDKPEMFLRLFDPTFTPFDEYLKEGRITSSIFYWNTIGSLDVLKKAKTLTCNQNPPCTRENSPSGHWSKNFAALSIHRRNDWSVAAKGFNKYTWDYESSPNQNVFGVFGSHGSLQISNRESSLKTYDVENGWNWSRVPGTTTVRIPAELRDIKLSRARNYNHNGKFAGGVSFIGSDGGNPKNGAFGMIFKKPDYVLRDELENTPLDQMKFEFKKSYFFYNSLIVCLGSDIKVSNVARNINPQTALFQDKFSDPGTTIQAGGNSYNLSSNNDLRLQWRDSSTVQLKDTNGNTYKVENSAENLLIVTIDSQSSKKSNGYDDTSGNYATAWIKHKERRAGKRSVDSSIKTSTRTKTSKLDYANGIFDKNIRNDIDEDDDYIDDDDNIEDLPDTTYSYKYAILVNGGNAQLLNKYTVIRQDANVHAIKLTALPGSMKKIYGYSIFENFDAAPLADGPVRSVSASCMIMAEKIGQVLHLAISDPTLKFGSDPSMATKQTCTAPEKRPPSDPFNPKGSNDIGNQLFFCVEGKASDAITVTLNVRIENTQGIKSIKVDGQASSSNPCEACEPVKLVNTDPTRSKLVFSNLVNGFTTEVKLAIAPTVGMK